MPGCRKAKERVYCRVPSAHLLAARKSEWERNQERVGKGGSPRDALAAP